MLVFTYHVFLQLGIVDGLIIKLPEWFIKKKNQIFIESLKISLTYIVTFIFLVILLAFTYFFLSNTLSKVILISLLYAISTIPYQIYNHYLLLNRYMYKMYITVYARLLVVLLRLAVQIPLMYFYGIIGLAFGELITYMIAALFIKLLSNSRLTPYMDMKYFKEYLNFGLPIFFISLIGILASTIERLIGAYYFNLETIAEIGILAFIGSLFTIVSGQILSLFSQYSREYLTATDDNQGLLGVYFIFVKLILFTYSILGSFFYLFLELFIIPNYLMDYINIIEYFVLIYLIFLVRISISVLSNWMLITGERLKIAYSSLLFCIIVITLSLIFPLVYNFTIKNLFTILVIAALIQLGLLIVYCLNLSGLKDGRAWLAITLSFHIFLPLLAMQTYDVGWLYFVTFSMFTHLIINMYFMQIKNSYGYMNKTLFILKRKYDQ